MMAVYFIRAGDDGPVKIGWALDVTLRIVELQCGNHLELHVIRTVDCLPSGERAAHRAFAGSRLRGEWFHFQPEMLSWSAPDGLPPPRRVVRSAALRAVLLAAGGPGKLADALSLTPQAVGQWERVPVERVLEVERLTGVSRTELRPDIYPADRIQSAESAA